MKRIQALYEQNCGGETGMVENIVRQMTKEKKLITSVFLLDRLKSTSFIGFFKWLLFSVTKSTIAISKRPNSDWIYTTTLTSGLAALILRPIYHHKICFHYFGNRIPDDGRTIPFGVRRISQTIKYTTAYRIQKQVFDRAEIILVPTNSTVKYLRRTFSLTNNRIVAIGNGINTDIFHPIPRAQVLKLRDKYQVSRNNKVIIFTGRPDTKKGILKLIDVFTLLVREINNIRLILVHTSPTTEAEMMTLKKIHTRIKEMNITDGVMLMENANMSEIYHLADISVSLSTEENLSVSMLESMACGVPYLTTHQGTFEFLRMIDNDLCVKSRDNQRIKEHLKKVLLMSNYRRNLLKLRLQKGKKLYDIGEITNNILNITKLRDKVGDNRI